MKNNEGKTDLKENPHKHIMRIFYAATIFIVVTASLLAITYRVQFGKSLSDSQAVWGAFGDFMGGLLNPAISFIAFSAFLYTIKIQFTELRNSTNQLEKSAKAVERQGEYFSKQNFENTFFRLIDYYQSIVNSLEESFEKSVDSTKLDSKENTILTIYKIQQLSQSQDTNDSEYQEPSDQTTFKGKRCVKKYAEAISRLVKENSKQKNKDETKQEEIIKISFRIFLRKYEHNLGHYFRITYQIMKLIENTGTLSEDQKKYYVSLFRSQISKYELTLLFYNHFSDHGKTKLAPILEKYNFFKNLQFKTLDSRSSKLAKSIIAKSQKVNN